MKKTVTGVLMAAAIASVIFAGIGQASAYFTTYAEALGTRTIHLGDRTEIEENFGSWKKEVRIHNDASSPQAVYVRALAFAGQDYRLDIAGENWEMQDDGYYHYAVPVEPDGYTDVLNVAISDIKMEDGVPEIIVGKDINVVVVYETTPAVQDGLDEDGNIRYLPEDWTKTVTREKIETGGDAS